jgi:hypothetical protein
MAVLSLPPSGSVRTKDVSNFQGVAPHEVYLRGVRHLQRADDFTQNLGGDLGIEGGRLKPMSRGT